MAKAEAEMEKMDKLDCKVEVRKYVLISRPSRWDKRGDRVVVQSPVLQIRNTDIRVPVKRFSGEEDNSVDFLPRKDIEKDASPAYDKERVSKTPVWIDAHGVAIADSSPEDELEYQRNDKFWIHVGASTSQHQTTVPVVNLRTHAQGTIGIRNVCWYPKMHGPNGEFWTLGGEARKLKHSGARKFTHWSFVICQKLDGSDPTTKSVEIPTKDTALPERAVLSSQDRRVLFERRLRKMLERLAQRNAAQLQKEGIMTPPSSPDSENSKHMKIVTTSQPVPSAPPQFGSIAESLKEVIPVSGGLSSLRRVLPPVLQIPRTSVMSNLLSGKTDLHDGGPQSLSRILPPLINTSHRRSFSRGYSGFNGNDVVSAQILCDLSKQITADRVAIASREIGVLPEKSRSLRSAIMGSESFADLCDRGEANCDYSSRFPFKHYHSPPHKCQLTDDRHRHCVSQRLPLPEYFGGCLLMASPSLGHACCHWKPDDRAAFPPRQRYVHHEVPHQEANKRPRTFQNMSSRIPHPTPPPTPLECENLTEAGRELYRDDCLSRSFSF